MKVICVDNYDRDTHDDKLVCENVNEFYAKKITDFLNEKFSGDSSDDYFKAVDDDHKLYKYEW
ncbi:hypothetical protein [Psychrobacillus phage Perkons]|nr:hypothetical protein [Psychrobacillus phage Perkons]